MYKSRDKKIKQKRTYNISPRTHKPGREESFRHVGGCVLLRESRSRSIVKRISHTSTSPGKIIRTYSNEIVQLCLPVSTVIGFSSNCGGLCRRGLGCWTLLELQMVTGGECGDMGSGLLPGDAVADVGCPNTGG